MFSRKRSSSAAAVLPPLNFNDVLRNIIRNWNKFITSNNSILYWIFCAIGKVENLNVGEFAMKKWMKIGWRDDDLYCEWVSRWGKSSE